MGASHRSERAMALVKATKAGAASRKAAMHAAWSLSLPTVAQLSTIRDGQECQVAASHAPGTAQPGPVNGRAGWQGPSPSSASRPVMPCSAAAPAHGDHQGEWAVCKNGSECVRQRCCSSRRVRPIQDDCGGCPSRRATCETQRLRTPACQRPAGALLQQHRLRFPRSGQPRSCTRPPVPAPALSDVQTAWLWALSFQADVS